MNYHIPPCKLDRNVITKIVCKYQTTDYQRPLCNNHQQIAQKIQTIVTGKDFIWDWGCGTAKSSHIIAKNNPEKIVIGVDQSIHRLQKSRQFQPQENLSQSGNLILVRANIIDLINCWQGPKANAQFWLHPNPYPKARQVKRRWPTNPIFGKAIMLANNTTMRTNWLSYAQNWANACTTLKLNSDLTIYQGQAITAFEQKYLKQNVRLYQVQCLAITSPNLIF